LTPTQPTNGTVVLASALDEKPSKVKMKAEQRKRRMGKHRVTHQFLVSAFEKYG
jgi:hypothetical protein